LPAQGPDRVAGGAALGTALLSAPRLRAKQLVTLRFCGQAWAFAFLREGLQRYPIEHTRFSKPLPGEHG
jgi:hypothetical protein